MKVMLSVSLFLFTLSSPLQAAPKPTDPESPQFKKAMELVRQLHDDRFAVRESASKKLIALGREAKEALLIGKEDLDADVADRCQRILPQAIAADMKARVDAFLADKEGKQEHDLPALGMYQKLVGKEKEARDLFATMLQTNSTLFEQYELDPTRFGKKYSVRCDEMIQFVFGRGGNRGPDFGDLATLFFFGTDPEFAKVTASNQYIGNLLYQPSFQNNIKNVAFRKLFFGWMEHRTDQNTVSQGLGIIQQHNLKEGLEFASKAMKDKGQQMYIRAQAINLVGRMGGKERIPDMEIMFNDDTQIQQFNLNNKVGMVQIRDVALAMAIHLSGQKPKEYGFEFLPNEQSIQSYYYLGFEDDEKRAATLKKYKGWVEEQKKKK